ncbi:transglutaminase TgpA family protein [Thiohalorhabdus sp.]|uniref:transglutaminase TgpA family protein n=1 Tax=Thiohalorhabdus sp. TaxID=3094134 RepID=UPI002FC3335F
MSAIRDSLPPRTLSALLLVLAVVAAPHAMRLPLWLTAVVVALGLWRLGIAWRGWPAPTRWGRVVLTLLLGAGVATAYGTVVGLDAGVALVTAMGGLKLLEMRRRRDTLVLIYLGYFLVITQFLYDQTMPMVAYLLFGVWGLTTVLIAVTRATGGDRPLAHGRLGAALVAQGLPLMVILFVLFPRVSGPLWGLPERSTAVTGLGDDLSPGGISQLSRSDAVAFRVELDDPPPAPDRRYWRGPVFTRYDGETWQAGRDRRGPVPEPRSRGRSVSYTVMLEPHAQRWLFTLDLPAAAPEDGRLGRDLTPLAEDPVHQVRRYAVRSYLEFRVQTELPPKRRQHYLALPDQGHPRARELAEGWRQQAEAPADVVERGLAHFRGDGFRYTLTPPAVADNWVDAFLFDTRAGFCGHYAGSYAFLMRAAGVPTRVVTGYLGGSLGDDGDTITVRQSDAHAWTEVWLADQGWVRIDPTSAVSPERAEEGLAGSVAAGEPVPAMARPEQSWHKTARRQLEEMDAAWNRWVLAYGPELQQRFLSRFGLGEWPRMVMGLGVALVVVGGLTAGVILVRRRPRRDAASAAFARFERKARWAGVPRRPGEGPRDFGERAAAAFPERAQALAAITESYLRLRYYGLADDGELRRLRRRIARLRLPRSRG